LAFVDLASLVGLVLVLIGVFVGMIMKGADPAAMFTNVAAILIVVVSAIGATVMASPMTVTTAALKALLKVFLPGPPPDMQGTIEKITGLADQARREGLLSLEDEAKRIEDPFLQKGLRMAVDGMESAQVKQTMLSDIKAMKDRHKTVAGWFSAVGIYAPSFGIIGAVVGLIAVMGKLDNPAAMGHGIGAAFVATFWGVFMANGMFLPWAAKLKALSAVEVAHKLLVVEGVIAVQQGSSPRTVMEQLNTHVPPAMRQEAA
jgi:chemotaxis protein MotA